MIAAMHRSPYVFILLLLVAALTQPCWAHAILMDSTPKANSVVKGPDFSVNLRFNVRIDAGRSRVRLVAPDGVVRKLILDAQPKLDTLQTHVSGLEPGAYKLAWQVLASDGHITSGEIPFTVN